VTAVAAAKAANAEQYAPYEYTAAVAYLHKAREEGGYANIRSRLNMGAVRGAGDTSESDRCREGYDGHDGCGRDGCGRDGCGCDRELRPD